MNNLVFDGRLLEKSFFDFELDITTDIFFKLSNLKRDLDLYVTTTDKDGNPTTFGNGKVANIGASTMDGIADETIFLRLAPGYYAAYIRENNGANFNSSLISSIDDQFTLEFDTATFASTSTLPDDPFLGYQWYLFNTGVLNPRLVTTSAAFTGSIAIPNVDIAAPEAWKLHNDASSIIIAIVDSGVDIDHPDLADNIWINTAEIPGNGLDDDGNGYVDDITGWNFVDGNPNQLAAEHGTHVAGIAAASGNNGIGISGVAWNAQIMSLDVFGSGTGAPAQAIVDAIYYAVKNGAKVINISLGLNLKANPEDLLKSDLLKAWDDAFAYAKTNDVFIAISAGNEGSQFDNLTEWEGIGNLDRYAAISPLFSRSHSNVASVVATDSVNERAAYSSYGQSATIGAPGGDSSKVIDLYIPGPGETGDNLTAEINFGILSTVPVGTGDPNFGRDYDFLQGTSMASPVIAGMAALIRSANPTISAQDTLAILRAGATAQSSLGNAVKGGLTANLFNSMQIAKNWTGAGDLLTIQQSDDTPVVNLSFLNDGPLTVIGKTTVSRSASLDPITGFYKTIDAVGSVFDSLGRIVSPGDINYASIALNESNIVSSISGVRVNDEKSITSGFSITDMTFLAPFAKVGDHTWFAFKDANVDGINHFKLLGQNQFGLEDTIGGGDRDFNDHIITFAVDMLA